MIQTNALHQDYDPKNPQPRSSRSSKWKFLLSAIGVGIGKKRLKKT